jgi:hypothetical protein
MTEKIYRVRRYSGQKGWSNYYHHADIITPHWSKAMSAAKRGFIKNWRWIDTFDVSDKDYESFELLGAVTREQSEKPKRINLNKRP